MPVMKNDTTPSFVIELELQLNCPQTRFVEKRMHAAVNIYNDCLGEALKRMHKIRHDRRYQDLLKQYAVLIAIHCQHIQKDRGYQQIARHLFCAKRDKCKRQEQQKEVNYLCPR